MSRVMRRILLLALAAGLAAPAGAQAAAGLRVVGGAPVSAPGYMALLMARTGETSAQACGGVAVAPYVLLTAAHCVVDERTNRWLTPDALRVVVGEDDPWPALGGPAFRTVQVIRLVAASLSTLGNGLQRNDVALLQLGTRAPAVARRAPRARTALTRAGRVGVVMGWGRVDGRVAGSSSPLLQGARMAVQRPGVCSSRMRGYDAASMLCVFGGTSSACMGDSGGPLVVSDRGRRYVIGVVSTGGGHCALEVPAVYSNVANGPLADFVAKQTSRLERLGAAHARGPGAGAAPAPQRPASTPAPAPRLGLGQARRAAERYGRVVRHWTSVTARCARRNVLRVACRIYGRRHGKWWMARREVLLSTRAIIVT